MRKGGFEPPRLSAPPPQDGVSASSTTSAIFLQMLSRAEGSEPSILSVLNLIMEAQFGKAEPVIEGFGGGSDFA